MSIEATLNERGNTYGSFEDVSDLSQDLQVIMRNSRNWGDMTSDKREALQTISSKIARILNGDPEHLDSWHDISGYATLVEIRIREGQQLRQTEWDKGEQRIDTIAASAGDGEHYDTLFLHEDIVVPAGMKYISVLDNGQAVAHKKRPELFISGGTLCWHPQGENEYIGMVDARFGLYEHMSNHWQKIEGLE